MTRDLKTADSQIEIFIGADNIARINLDGVCALRVRLNLGCQIVLRNSHAASAIFTVTELEGK